MDHWHPVLESEQLRQQPVQVKLAGHSIALFRTNAGVPAALTDICPHRRMRLSQGVVIGERLQCSYHGWSFDACGRGESPGTPKLHACAETFDVREAYGAVWIKSAGSTPSFPRFDVAGYLPICRLRHQIPAPLELVVDNFCEIEHTPTVHGLFGYDLARMHEVAVRFEPTETSVRVINSGPSKPMGLLLGTMLGVHKHDHFYDDWTTYFSPVYSVYDHWWADPATGRESRVRWRLYLFFTPLDDARTEVMTFAFAKSRWPGPAGGLRLCRWLMRKHLDREIQLDVDILAGLGSYDTGIAGLKLSRFDRALGLNRERIDRVYRQREPVRGARRAVSTPSLIDPFEVPASLNDPEPHLAVDRGACACSAGHSGADSGRT